MKNVTPYLSKFFVSCALLAIGYTTQGVAAVVSITHTSSSILNSVTVDRNGTSYTLNESELIGIDLVDFYGENPNVILTGDGESPPTAGSRATLLEDNRIDTGIINARDYSNAMTVNFLSPVVNGPGVDVIWFEFDGSNEGDDLYKLRIGDQFLLNYGSDGIVITGNSIDTDVYSTGTTPTTIGALESATLSKLTSVSASLWAYSLDLSDLGIADGASVSSMQFGSQDGNKAVDTVYFAGLPVIPEPGTLTLVCLSLGSLLLFRRKK